MFLFLHLSLRHDMISSFLANFSSIGLYVVSLHFVDFVTWGLLAFLDEMVLIGYCDIFAQLSCRFTIFLKCATNGLGPLLAFCVTMSLAAVNVSNQH